MTTRGSKGTRTLFHEKIECRPDAKETSNDTIHVRSEKLERVETEQHELDPEGTGTDELVSDEMPHDDEEGCDSETSARKPLTSSQRKVVQNIHNNCGHPSKEEFLRALRLSRARPEVLTTFDESSSVQHVQPKGILQNLGFQQRCRRTFRFNETLGVDLFEIESLDGSKSFSATWCVGARCINCAFLSWTRHQRRL